MAGPRLGKRSLPGWRGGGGRPVSDEAEFKRFIADCESMAIDDLRALVENRRIPQPRRIGARRVLERRLSADRQERDSERYDLSIRQTVASERQAAEAREANEIARGARTIATIALVFSVIGLAVTIVGIFVQ